MKIEFTCGTKKETRLCDSDDLSENRTCLICHKPAGYAGDENTCLYSFTALSTDEYRKKLSELTSRKK